jgi:hypothetical protein
MGKTVRGFVVLACTVMVIPACNTSPDGGETSPTAPPVGLNKPPTARIVTPIDGAVVQSGVALDINVAAADPDGGIAAVAIFEGSNRLATLLTAPFVFSWVPVIEGTFSLTAVATDTSGASTTSDPVSVVVQTPGTNPGPTPPNLPPIVSITNPVDGAIFVEGTSITLSANATDPDGPSLVVEYFDGTTSIGAASLIPFVVNWSGATQGPHSIRAVATDALGGSTSSVPVSIFITPRTTSSSPTGALKGASSEAHRRGRREDLSVEWPNRTPEGILCALRVLRVSGGPLQGGAGVGAGGLAGSSFRARASRATTRPKRKIASEQ